MGELNRKTIFLSVAYRKTYSSLYSILLRGKHLQGKEIGKAEVPIIKKDLQVIHLRSL